MRPHVVAREPLVDVSFARGGLVFALLLPAHGFDAFAFRVNIRLTHDLGDSRNVLRNGDTDGLSKSSHVELRRGRRNGNLDSLGLLRCRLRFRSFPMQFDKVDVKDTLKIEPQ